MSLRISKHGVVRCQQRALRPTDIDLIMRYGVETPDGYLLTDTASAEAQARLAYKRRRLEKLRGKLLVVRDGVLVTAFHATKAQQHQRLARRGGHE